MIDITAANSVNLQKKPGRPRCKTWRTRDEAKRDAVAAIGPHARHEYEYETFKCDGRWHWRPTDTVRSASEAELKAIGGRRGLPPSSEGSTARLTRGAVVYSPYTCKRTSEAPKDVAGHSAALTIKDAVEAAIAAGLSPTEFCQLAEFVADELNKRRGLLP